jgi:hypothetical protein
LEDDVTFVFRSIVILSLIAGSLMADDLINTIPVWDGSQYISSFGVVNTATYGQTITVAGSSMHMQSFAVEIGYCGASVTFRGEVYAWDGSKATGASLFEGSVQTIPNTSSYQLYTINTGSLTLPPGNYVVFLSTSKDQSGAPSSACRFGSVTNTSYGGGQFVYINNGANPALWTTNAWSTIASDLAIQITGYGGVPGVPLPSSLPLVVFGLVALGLLGRALLPGSHS